MPGMTLLRRSADFIPLRTGASPHTITAHQTRAAIAAVFYSELLGCLCCSLYYLVTAPLTDSYYLSSSPPRLLPRAPTAMTPTASPAHFMRRLVHRALRVPFHRTTVTTRDMLDVFRSLPGFCCSFRSACHCTRACCSPVVCLAPMF